MERFSELLLSKNQPQLRAIEFMDELPDIIACQARSDELSTLMSALDFDSDRQMAMAFDRDDHN
jgi:hypothetical protein